MVGWAEKSLLVLRHKVEVIDVSELIDESWFWERLLIVIDEPSRDVVVQGVREGVE